MSPPRKKARDPEDRERFDALFAAREELAEGSGDLLLQAKALILCALPYKRVQERILTRRAQLGSNSTISVTFGALGSAGLPFGADRALLGWIQTRAFNDGFITFDRLTEFFGAFGLNDSGENYRVFRERVDRLKGLSLHVEYLGERDEAGFTVGVIEGYRLPRSGSEARATVADERAGQLLLIPQRYGFQLDPVFWKYLRSNPVPLPLPLMRLFHNKPKGWDFAQFILYRCFAARQRSVIPWDAFAAQLGSTDQNPRQLRASLKRYLAEMKVIYPDLPAAFLPESQGLEVAPWRPPKNPQ